MGRIFASLAGGRLVDTSGQFCPNARSVILRFVARDQNHTSLIPRDAISCWPRPRYRFGPMFVYYGGICTDEVRFRGSKIWARTYGLCASRGGTFISTCTHTPDESASLL